MYFQKKVIKLLCEVVFMGLFFFSPGAEFVLNRDLYEPPINNNKKSGDVMTTISDVHVIKVAGKIILERS